MCALKYRFNIKILGKTKFKANWDHPKIKLSDPFGVTIHNSEFIDIVNNYYRSGSWYINIDIIGDENQSGGDLITSMVNITLLFNLFYNT